MRSTSVTSPTSQGTASKRIPILLADNNDYGVLAVVRALRAAGYEPWLAINDANSYAARSRTTAGTVPVLDPSFDGEGFVHELAAAAVRISEIGRASCRERV